VKWLAKQVSHFIFFSRLNTQTMNVIDTTHLWGAKPYGLIKRLFTPFEVIDKRTMTTVAFLQLGILLYAWSFWVPTRGFFPNLLEVLGGWNELWHDGLAVHIWQTLKLCFTATLISIFFSSIIAYGSKLPFFSTIAKFATYMRYNPISGFTLFLTQMTGGGRNLQVTMLVIFMSFYFITGLMAVIDAIPEEDYLRRKAQGMGRWRILWRVVITDRWDALIMVILQNLPMTFMMIVAVEAMNKGAGGLGSLIVDTSRGLNFPRIFAIQITITILGVLIDTSLRHWYNTFPANAKR
jgi:NitT/TauT family transport system permease protein